MANDQHDSRPMKTRDRSPEYPAISLKQAVENTRKLYEKDRQSWTASEIAAKHLGYSGLSGSSRTTLSAMKKFGLIEYKGGDLKVSDFAMGLILPTNPEESAETLLKALTLPRIYGELLEEYPDWNLPSDETMEARLIRDKKFNPSAVKAFIRDLKESIEFANARGRIQNSSFTTEDSEPVFPNPINTGLDTHVDKTAKAPEPKGSSSSMLGIPGADWFVSLPQTMDTKDAKKMLKWVKVVLIPQLEFLSLDEED